MSNQINDGGPAFPVNKEIWNLNQGYIERCQEPVYPTGMSLRAYFAGEALKGIISNETYMANISPKEDVHAVVASSAIRFADALIHQLSQPQTTTPKPNEESK